MEVGGDGADDMCLHLMRLSNLSLFLEETYRAVVPGSCCALLYVKVYALELRRYEADDAYVLSGTAVVVVYCRYPPFSPPR